MERLSETVLRRAQRLPEGTPVLAKGLLHLGSRAAVDQALSRLVRRGALLRVGRGVYVLPVEGRFGHRAPSVKKTVEGLAAARGDHIANSGAMAAHLLGLTTRVPVKRIFSDVRAEPDVDARPRADRIAPCAGMATSVGWSACRRGDPGARLAGA